jgi:hypothetical protein
MSRVLGLLQATGEVGACVAASIVALHFLWLQVESRR